MSIYEYGILKMIFFLGSGLGVFSKGVIIFSVGGVIILHSRGHNIITGESLFFKE